MSIPARDSQDEVHMKMPEGLHPDTKKLVLEFAYALAKKLASAERKYGYSNTWKDKDWMDECRAKLLDHIKKGDPRDVAAYCAFLWHHGQPTAVKTKECPHCDGTGVSNYVEMEDVPCTFCNGTGKSK